MSHQVLQCFWIHAGTRLIATVGVSTYMRRNLWKLRFIDTVIFFDSVLKILLPVQCHQRHFVFIQKQESPVAIDNRLNLVFFTLLQNNFEAFINFRRHRDLPGSGISLGAFYSVFHIGPSHKLMVNINFAFLHIQIFYRQSAKFRNSHASMKQDIKRFIVPTKVFVFLYKVQEFSHLIQRNCLSYKKAMFIHDYELIFYWNNLKDNPDSYDIFDYKNTPELSNGGSTTWDFAIPISNNHFICCTETYRLFPVNAKTGTFKDEICYTPGLAICGCKFKKAIMSEECMKIIKSNRGII